MAPRTLGDLLPGHPAAHQFFRPCGLQDDVAVSVRSLLDSFLSAGKDQLRTACASWGIGARVGRQKNRNCAAAPHRRPLPETNMSVLLPTASFLSSTLLLPDHTVWGLLPGLLENLSLELQCLETKTLSCRA